MDTGEGGGRLRHEPEESLTLLGKDVAVLPGQSLERLDHERSLPVGPLRLPRPPHEAVDEERGRYHAVFGGERPSVIVGDEAGAIGVGRGEVGRDNSSRWASPYPGEA